MYDAASSDYSRAQGITVTISASDTEAFVEVAITNDQILEGSENFIGMLTLPPGSGGVSLGLDRTTVSIVDDDGEKYYNVFLRTCMQFKAL